LILGNNTSFPNITINLGMILLLLFLSVLIQYIVNVRSIITAIMATKFVNR